MILSFFYHNQWRKLEAFEHYLVNNYNGPFQRKLIDQALKIASRYDIPLVESAKEHTVIHHSIIVKKNVSENERGIIIVSFESELLKLVQSSYFPQIESQYQILFVPSWHPFYSASLFLLAARAEKDFFIMPSSFEDMDLCNEISKTCIPLPFHAASWVNEEFYPSERKEKNIDIIMVANFNKYKRHWRLFEALRDLPRNLVVYLAGVPIGSRTQDKLLKEAKAFGVENQISIFEGPSDKEIIDMMARSKIFCALSHKEGSYIAVAESLIAGTPVGMYANAMIGTKAYINDETGVLFNPNDKLAPQIADFIERSESLRPSQWARNNISAGRNVDRLNKIFCEYSASNGYDWSVDLERFYSRHFDFLYYRNLDAENDFKMTYGEFEEEFGLTIERPVVSKQGV